ncbi:MAG: molybdopterin molybdotransferase MoeA [Nitrospirota bacterium]
MQSKGKDLEEAKRDFFDLLPSESSGIEYVSILESHKRVLAKDIQATYSSPLYTMATLDGYALATSDISFASKDKPVILDVAGRVKMGEVSSSLPSAETAFYIPTGGMIPDGADAVVRKENVKIIDDGKKIEVYAPLDPFENMELEGKRIKEGKDIIKEGVILRPEHIALLAEFNIQDVPVSTKPEVAIFSTGDEIIDLSEELSHGKTRDVNSYVISAMVEECGGIPKREGIVADDFDLLRKRILDVMDKSSMVILTGGTAVGGRDFTADVLESIGSPGVIVNGVAMKNGRPIVLAVASGKPIIGLAGYPPGAMFGFELFAKPTIERLLGVKEI